MTVIMQFATNLFTYLNFRRKFYILLLHNNYNFSYNFRNLIGKFLQLLENQYITAKE